jgi:hypothetical protein
MIDVTPTWGREVVNHDSIQFLQRIRFKGNQTIEDNKEKTLRL